MFSGTFTAVANEASVYYVDAASGDDNTGEGSSENPWKTISKAASVAKAGDTVKIRSGVYRETVTPANSGTAGSYITFMADDGADVTISGADRVEGSWLHHSGNIYKTTATLNMGDWKNQVFVDGISMNLARWPNAGTDPMKPVFLTADNGTDNSKIIDGELTQPDGFWDGAAVVVLDKYRWGIASSIVTSYTKGQLNLGTIYTYGLGIANGYGSPYYLIGKLEALDGPNEWYYDKNTHTLYLQTPESDDPSEHTVEVKARNLAFDLSGKNYIRIKGIKFFACTVNTSLSTGIELDGLDVRYPSHYELSHDGAEHNWRTSGIILGGTNNVLKNSTVAYCPGNLVMLDGQNNQVVNNVLHDAGYGPFYTTEVANINVRGKNHLVSHNTLYNAGRSVIAGSPDNARIQYNHGYNAMQLTDDGGFMYFAYVDGNGTEIHHNIFNGTPEFSPPNNIVGGIYFDHGTANFKVYNNVVCNTPKFGVFVHYYNEFIEVYNNTAYNVSKFRMKDDGGALDAYGVRVINNIAYEDLPIAEGFGVVEKNNFKSGDPLFTDPENGDLSLQETSPAINAGAEIIGINDGYIGSAPDIGAYEYGNPIWTAGHNFESPPSPVFTTVKTQYQTLLDNGFFERERETVGGWTKTHSKTAVIERSQNEATSSRYAWTWGLKLGTGEDGVEQTVTGLKPNTEYELRGFGRAAAGGQKIRIGVKDYGGEEKFEEVTSTVWTRKKIRFTTGPESTGATIYVYKPTSGGFAFADDMTLMEVDPTAPEELEFDDTPDDLPEEVIAVNDSEVGTGLNKFNFTGNWGRGPNLNSYKGDNTHSNTPNAYYEVKFLGKQIILYSELSNVMGIVAVSIDSGEEVLIDLYSPENKHKEIVYTSPELQPGEHTLKVRITGDKHPDSKGTWHVADRVDIVTGGLMPPEPEPEPEPIFVDVYVQDFESINPGDIPDGWTFGTDDPIAITEDHEGNRRLTATESGNGTTTTAICSFDPIKKAAKVSLRVMAEQTGKSCNFLTLLDSDGKKVVEILFDNDYDQSGRRNIARRTPDGNYSSLMKYEANKWYEVEVEVNLSEGIYNVKIDGADIIQNVPILNASGDIVQYSFAPHRWDKGTFHVDNLRISKGINYGLLYSQDFEDIETGSMPEELKGDEDGHVSVTEDVYRNHRLTFVETANGKVSNAVYSFEKPVKDRVGISFRIMAEQTGKKASFLYLKDSNDKKVLELFFDQGNNYIKRSTGSSFQAVMEYNPDKWYTVSADVYLATGTYSVSIDGVSVLENVPVLNEAKDIAQYLFAPYRYDEGIYHLDDLKIFGAIPEDEPVEPEEPGDPGTGFRNIAPLATATADSVNGAYTPDKAIDGIKNDHSSRWVSGNTSEEHWIQLDWDRTFSIEKVNVWSGNLTQAGWQIEDFRIQYWSGSEWTTVAEVTDNTKDIFNSGDYNELVFPAVKTQKLRMYITDGCVKDGYTDARLYEMEVWGEEDDSTPPGPVQVESITVTGSVGLNYITKLGAKLQMQADVLPENADNRTVTWSVKGENGEDTDLAVITSDGLLTALKDGVVKVIAAANDGSGVTGECLVTINSAAWNSNFKEIYSQNFESGIMPEEFTGDGDNEVDVTREENGNYRMTLAESGNQTSSNAVLDLNPVVRDRIRVDVRIMADQTGRLCSFIYLKDSKGTKVLDLLFDQDYDKTGRQNLAYKTSDSSYSSFMKYNPNQWYEVSVIADLNSDTYSVSVDGVKLLENKSFMNSAKVDDIAQYLAVPNRWEPGTFHIDDIRIYKHYIATVPAVAKLGTGDADFRINAGESVELVFSEPLSDAGKASVESALLEGADNEITFSWNAENSILTITAGSKTVTFREDVVADVESAEGVAAYNLLLVDSSDIPDFTVQASFKVGNTDNATELVANQLLDASVSVTNNRETDRQVVLIVALYDAGGDMVNVSYISKNIEANATENFHAGFKLPGDVTGYTVKAFVWEGVDIATSGMIPVSNVITLQ